MLNKTTIIGRLGADPELRKFPSGDYVCNLRVATSERWKDKNGEAHEHTEWFSVVIRRGAENASEYLKKGSLIHIDGRLRTRTYEKDGQKRYIVELHADNWLNISRGESDKPASKPSESKPHDSAFDGFDDDIPF